tara:strand:- start:545 stop:1471 length:927 start_codon:yes stop_codon:yes gene_type:complete
MLALGQKFFSRKNEFIRYFADASYWVYWVHLPVTFYFSMVLQPVEINTLFKAYIAVIISTVLIMLMYMLLVRNTILGNYFCGWRKPIKEDPFLKYISAKWKLLAVKTIAFGFVAFAVGQVMHVAILKKNNALLVESFILRNEPFIRDANNVNTTDEYGQNALFTAVQRVPVNLRKYDSVALLIEKGINVNHRDKFGRTPLYMACRSGVLPDIEKLLKAGADPNVQENKYGHSPIHVAAIKLGGKYLDGWTKGVDGTEAIKNYKDIFRLLLENGANLGFKDKQGRDVEALLNRFTPFKLEDLKADTVSQ